MPLPADTQAAFDEIIDEIFLVVQEEPDPKRRECLHGIGMSIFRLRNATMDSRFEEADDPPEKAPPFDPVVGDNAQVFIGDMWLGPDFGAGPYAAIITKIYPGRRLDLTMFPPDHDPVCLRRLPPESECLADGWYWTELPL